MKFNKEAIEKAKGIMFENPFWHEMYIDAPKRAKERLEIAFWASQYLDEREDVDAYREARESVERSMTIDDAQFLADRFPEGAGKTHYKELVKRLRRLEILTPEKLTAAIKNLILSFGDEDQEIVWRTQSLLDACTDPFYKYEWLWEAVGGKGESALLIGDMFEHGHGVEINYDLALYWFHRGAMSGNGESCYRLACLFEDEDSMVFNFKEAAFWFAEGIRRDDVTTRYELGARLTIWKEGPWVEKKNPEYGIMLIKDAIKEDDSGCAKYYMGRCYEEGAGVEKNLKTARRYYRMASDDGHRGAKEALERLKGA